MLTLHKHTFLITYLTRPLLITIPKRGMAKLNTYRLFIHYIKYYLLYQIALWWAITYACRILIDYPTNVVYAEGFNMPYIPEETIRKVTDSPANTVPKDKSLFERFFTCTDYIPDPVDENATVEPTDQSSATPVPEVCVVARDCIPEDTGNTVLSHKTFINKVLLTTMELLADKHPSTNASDIPDDSVKETVFTVLSNPDERQQWITGRINDEDSNVSRRIQILHAMYKDPQATPSIKKMLGHIITSMSIMTQIHEKHLPLEYNTTFTGTFYDIVSKELDRPTNANLDTLDVTRPELSEENTLIRIQFIEHLLNDTITHLITQNPKALDITDVNQHMIQNAIITFLKQEGDIPWLAKTVDDLGNEYHEANLRIGYIIDIVKNPESVTIPPLNLLVLQSVIPTLIELNEAIVDGKDLSQFLNDYAYSS